ncbi:MAG: DUF4013 domain-containing protein [Methanobrevibacter sp.]|nr:DUF4013 domain-containing protein [Methanobrevibacter sp.]
MNWGVVMPVFKMKKVWDYCTYNKPFFILVLILFAVLNYFIKYYEDKNFFLVYGIIIVSLILIFGYGMIITRDRMNDGVRLPKILVKDVIVLGLKSFFVTVIYLLVQGHIIDLICSPLNFPEFDLKDMLLDLPHTLDLLFSHNPIDALVFVFVGAIFFYVTMFFMEIALARLADSGKLLSAFNLVAIKRNIDVIGWGNYTKEYTRIVLAIVLFSLLQYIDFQFFYLNYLWEVVLTLFVFTTEYLGIGAIYQIVKEKESE